MASSLMASSGASAVCFTVPRPAPAELGAQNPASYRRPGPRRQRPPRPPRCCARLADRSSSLATSASGPGVACARAAMAQASAPTLRGSEARALGDRSPQPRSDVRPVTSGRATHTCLGGVRSFRRGQPRCSPRRDAQALYERGIAPAALVATSVGGLDAGFIASRPARERYRISSRRSQTRPPRPPVVTASASTPASSPDD